MKIVTVPLLGLFKAGINRDTAKSVRLNNKDFLCKFLTNLINHSKMILVLGGKLVKDFTDESK